MASWLLAAVFVSLVSIALAFVPLFNLLAFEFSVGMGALLAYVSGWRACAAAASARQVFVPRQARRRGFPGAALLQVGVQNLLLLFFPLVIMGANAVRVPNCNWSEGLQFYALFTVPGVLYGTTLGFALGLAHRTGWARFHLLLWSLATYVYVLWNIVRQPPIFAYNAFVGFFPGPLYDQAVPLTPLLLLARTIVVVEAILFALLAVMLWDGVRLRWRALSDPWTGARAVAGPLALCALLVFAALQVNAGRLGLRPDAGDIRRALGGHLATEHCDVYYDVQAYTRERAQELAREHEFHYAELREFFGFDVPGRIGSYVYASAEKKKRLMGAGGTSFEDALTDEIHLNAASWPHPVLRHELAHIFAAHLQRWWPICPQIGIHEGIAVAAEWREESGRLGLTPDEACAAMDSLGLLPDLGSLLGAFGFWTQPGARAYTAAGSFVHHLVTAYGMEPFRVLWSTRKFERAYGRSLDDLVREWKRVQLAPVRLTPLQLLRAERLYRPPAIFALPCAREQARLQTELAGARQSEQFARAESLYAGILRLEPDSPSHQLGLARLYLEAGKAAESRRALLALLDTPALPQSWRGRALDELGDAQWTLGEFEGAAASYAGAESLAVSRPERRAFQVARAALRAPELRQALCPYLTEVLPEAAGLASLAWVRAQVPSAPLPRYLLGRRLYYAERFAEAREELGPLAAATDTVLSSDVKLAVLELRALAELRGGAPQGVDSTLADLGGYGLEAAEALHFEDLRRRAAWALRLEAPGTQARGPH